MSGLSDVAAALVRLADAADRAVFLGEAWSVAMGVVDPLDVGMTRESDERDEETHG